MKLKSRALLAAASMAFAGCAMAADFATPGGPEPANAGEVMEFLRQDPYDLELLISFGTSKGGSAGHLALAIRGAASGDDLVWSANFYADRDKKHAEDFYVDDLMVAIPKKEYLYGTRSTVSPKASFGLDFGEVYKRSVIGVRVRGVPAGEKEALSAFFRRLNDDFHRRARNTEYHDREVKYDYLRLNCAKTIGSAFRFGAGYSDVKIENAALFSGRRIAAAANANIPTEMALKLLKAWDARGYGMDVVLYRKYGGSTWVAPHDEEKVAFKDLPNRFPSVLSRDFRKDEGEYRDVDNLFAMYLFNNLGRYGIRVNGATKRLEIGRSRHPMAYPEAAKLAAESARSDSAAYEQRAAFKAKGTRIGEEADEGDGKAAP
jgi:hypothetical protein